MGLKQPQSVAAFAVLAAIALLAGCERPTRDQLSLQAIKAESKTLMRIYPTETFVEVPQGSWPPVIARLKPQLVFVRSESVDIVIKPYFDGGWGYYVPLSDGEHPEPKGRYTELGHNVYWYHPF